MVIAALFFSVMGVFVKLAGERLSSHQIVFARSFVALILSYAALRHARIRPWGNNKRLLLLRGTLGFASLSCWFYAITHLDLADAMVIQFTNPLFAALLAAVWLRERLTWRELTAAAASLTGVALVAQPTFLVGTASGTPDPFAVTIALLGAIGSGFTYVVIRKLRETDEGLVVVFYFPLIGTPLAIPAMWGNAVWPTPVEWLLLLGVGVTVQLAQVHMTRGLHKETASRATSVSYLQVALAFVWGILIFGEYPSWTSILGAALIVGSVLGVVLRPFSRPPSSSAGPHPPAPEPGAR